MKPCVRCGGALAAHEQLVAFLLELDETADPTCAMQNEIRSLRINER